MLLDTLVGCTIKTKNEDEWKALIEKMFHNEYRSQSETGVKPNGVLELYANNVVLDKLEVNTKQIVGATIIPANLS